MRISLYNPPTEECEQPLYVVERIERSPAAGAVTESGSIVLEVPVRRLDVRANFLVSYCPVRADSFDVRSRVARMLVPEGSVVPVGVCADVYWLPPLREEGPVPANTYHCESENLTNWHSLALGLFPQEVVNEFLDEACRHNMAAVRRDLWEYTGSGPDLGLFHGWQEIRPDCLATDLQRLPSQDAFRILRYRTPLELCRMAKRSLLEGYKVTPAFGELTAPIQEVIRWSEWMKPAD